MDRCVGAAARLPESDRKDLAVQALARSATVSDLSTRHGVSRKFIYQQADKARRALDDAFNWPARIRAPARLRRRGGGVGAPGGAGGTTSRWNHSSATIEVC
jgi:hypothetical protein